MLPAGVTAPLPLLLEPPPCPPHAVNSEITTARITAHTLSLLPCIAPPSLVGRAAALTWRAYRPPACRSCDKHFWLSKKDALSSPSQLLRSNTRRRRSTSGRSRAERTGRPNVYT